MYDLNDELLNSFQELHDAALNAFRCDAVWQINARGRVYDGKYHAGAGELVDRKRIHSQVASPSFLQTNVPIVCIRLNPNTLYLFPDRILVYCQGEIGAIDYQSLEIARSTTQFIESEYLPHDALVTGHTWQYVNKGGGPDRRFNNNRELPICLYEEAWLRSTSGMNELLHFSEVGATDPLSQAVTKLASAIQTSQQVQAETERLAAANAIKTPRQTNSSTEETPEKYHRIYTLDQLCETLFNAMCCVMAADGRITREEQIVISRLMRKAQAPWDSERLKAKLFDFTQRIRSESFGTVCSASLEALHCFKAIQKEEVVLESLKLVMEADGSTTPKKLALCRKIRQIMT